MAIGGGAQLDTCIYESYVAGDMTPNDKLSNQFIITICILQIRNQLIPHDNNHDIILYRFWSHVSLRTAGDYVFILRCTIDMLTWDLEQQSVL